MPIYECMVCGASFVKGFKPDECPECESNVFRKVSLGHKNDMLYLRKEHAFELLEACLSIKEKLVVRYFMFNGLCPMELANARIEHLDPVDGILFLPRVHWKDNQTKEIDPETVRLQIIYSGSRKKGPLLVSRKTRGHYTPCGLWDLIKRIAMRTNIPNKEKISPLNLKRTFARLFLKTPGNTLLDLQRAFCHKHIWSTGHYLRVNLDDAKEAKNRMMKGLAKDIREKVTV